MNDLNSVALIGRLTRDAELKYTKSGTAVCKFAIAVNSKRKDGDQWIEEASFFDVVLWGKSGEALNQYLLKGKQVAIQGELKQERWEQDGQARSRIGVTAHEIQLLGGGENREGAKQEARQEPQASGAKSEPEYFSDDIPF